MDAAGYYNPVDQMGVNDAYITVNLTKRVNFPLQVNVGAYTGRYGAMGTYDAGRYGTPLIAQTNTIGEEITAAYKVGDLLLLLDQGLGGQLGTAAGRPFPRGLERLRGPQRGRNLRQPGARRRCLPPVGSLRVALRDRLDAGRSCRGRPRPRRTHHRDGR